MSTHSNDIIEFENLKKDVLNLIANADVTITPKTSIHDSGIYLLYVDNFEDGKIIPFYIGKTLDFQKRFQTHVKSIKALVDYSYAEYHNKFLWKKFEGNYRPCKIFKYIIDHNCSVDDVKMIVLEKCEEADLDEREQYYLSLYLPAYFGFNQIASITEQFKYRNDPLKMKLIIEQDSANFQKYIEYGYSTFNYLHAFRGSGTLELDQKVNQLLSNDFWLPREDLLSRAIADLNNYQNVYQEIYAKIRDKFAVPIHNIFVKCKFKSTKREEDVLAAFTNHYRTIIVDDVSQNLDYLKYYFNRNKKSRECGELIRNLYYKNADEINQIITPVKEAFVTYIESITSIIDQSEYSIIFPKKPFRGGDSV